MPVYTYRCTNCGVEFDQQQSFSEEPLIKCPECGKKTLKKVYQPVGIVFKGSGFYATDHHSPSGRSPKKDDKDSSAESKPAEAKPEKKDAPTSTPPASKDDKSK